MIKSNNFISKNFKNITVEKKIQQSDKCNNFEKLNQFDNNEEFEIIINNTNFLNFSECMELNKEKLNKYLNLNTDFVNTYLRLKFFNNFKINSKKYKPLDLLQNISNWINLYQLKYRKTIESEKPYGNLNNCCQINQLILDLLNSYSLLEKLQVKNNKEAFIKIEKLEKKIKNNESFSEIEDFNEIQDFEIIEDFNEIDNFEIISKNITFEEFLQYIKLNQDELSQYFDSNQDVINSYLQLNFFNNNIIKSESGILNLLENISNWVNLYESKYNKVSEYQKPYENINQFSQLYKIIDSLLYEEHLLQKLEVKNNKEAFNKIEKLEKEEQTKNIINFCIVFSGLNKTNNKD